MVFLLYLLAAPFSALVCVAAILEGVWESNWPLVALGASASAALSAGVAIALGGIKDARARRW